MAVVMHLGICTCTCAWLLSRLLLHRAEHGSQGSADTCQHADPQVPTHYCMGYTPVLTVQALQLPASLCWELGSYAYSLPRARVAPFSVSLAPQTRETCLRLSLASIAAGRTELDAYHQWRATGPSQMLHPEQICHYSMLQAAAVMLLIPRLQASKHVGASRLVAVPSGAPAKPVYTGDGPVNA